jgi:hypothetical protein
MSIYAEDINYWQTGQSSADTWIDRAEKEIKSIKGTIISEVFGAQEGQAAFMLEFRIENNVYKVVWPVLKSKTGNVKAAKIQAATMLYHDVKAKCMTAKVLGVQKAFFSYLLLEDGRVASEVGGSEIAALIPHILLLSSEVK